MRVKIAPDPDSLCQLAARRLARHLDKAIRNRGQAHLALAGGSTPRGLYQALARLPDELAPAWTRVRFYFGDERAVPPDHPDSNYRMARESLFAPLRIPPEQIQRIHAELSSEQVVRHYSTVLQGLPHTQNWPRFDVILLGMGEDGHTASLFPDSPLLAERQQSFTGAEVANRGLRYSLTLPVLNHARHLLMLVSGSDKAATVQQALQTPDAGLPVQLLDPARLEWYLDAAAASGLDPESMP